MRDLSVVIPARNEQFLEQTVDSVLRNIEADTEIIVVLDGAWPDKGLEDNERLTIIKNGESIGQRQAANQAIRLSTAKYIMKLDAHCDVDKGFDRKLIEGYKENCIDIPAQYNLHAFDWVCKECTHREYQGPKPEKCEKCGHENVFMDIVWARRESRLTTTWRFDSDLRFGYWGDFQTREEYNQDISPTLSCLGACWFLSREYYWELDGLDEDHGSWGQMGTELGCKTWLYGGEMRCNKNTWFAHMFRTQDGFKFPYPISGNQVEKARRHSKKLWVDNRWPKAKHSLEWLINKFAPVPGWETGGPKINRKAVVYYTDSRLKEKIAEPVRKQLTRGIKEKHIISVSLEKLDFARNIVVDEKPSSETMFRQILTGLKALGDDENIVFFCEHDVLYHPKHFDFIPPKEDVIYYNTNVWKLRTTDGFCYRTDDCRQLSGLVAYKDVLIKHFEKRLKVVEENGFSMKIGYEPGTHNRKDRVDDLTSETYESKYPNIDLRHSDNLTKTKWSPEEFRNKKYAKGFTVSKNLPGWGDAKELAKQYD